MTARKSSHAVRIEPRFRGYCTDVVEVAEGFAAIVTTPAGVVVERFVAGLDARDRFPAADAVARAERFLRDYRPWCSGCGTSFRDVPDETCECGACRGRGWASA